jgi:hypothetical protein
VCVKRYSFTSPHGLGLDGWVAVDKECATLASYCLSLLQYWCSSSNMVGERLVLVDAPIENGTHA